MRLAMTLGGTDLGRSGIGVCVRAALPRLRRRLHESGGQLIAIGTPRELDAYGDLLEGVERELVPAIVQHPLPNALWHLVAAGRTAARARADVLLLPAATRRTTARSPIPTVAVVHDLAQLHVQQKYDALRMAYLKHLVIGALGAATELVAVSETTRTDMAAALGRPISSMRVVLNGVDHERFSSGAAGAPRAPTARRQLGLDRPYLLYLSRLEHPGKNHLRLIRAYADSRARASHDLVLSGADWGALALIRAEIARLSLGDRVRLPGYVADDLVPELVQGADAVVMVGLREGFGLPALEALAAGRPLVIARAGALPEVAGELAATCDPLDERSITQALDRAVEDEVLRARAAHEGPARAAARSWDLTVDGLLAACRDAIHLRPGVESARARAISPPGSTIRPS
jgi:glycosyltransferase involved in cell wall biosynthesis